jgi:hypothetical protein
VRVPKGVQSRAFRSLSRRNSSDARGADSRIARFSSTCHSASHIAVSRASASGLFRELEMIDRSLKGVESGEEARHEPPGINRLAEDHTQERI